MKALLSKFLVSVLLYKNGGKVFKLTMLIYGCTVLYIATKKMTTIEIYNRAHISGRQTPGLTRGLPPAFVI
jgi:hypothetical protein